MQQRSVEKQSWGDAKIFLFFYSLHVLVMLESQSPENRAQKWSSLCVLASGYGRELSHGSSPVGKGVQVRKGTWLDHSGLICLKEPVIFLLKIYVLCNFKIAFALVLGNVWTGELSLCYLASMATLSETANCRHAVRETHREQVCFGYRDLWRNF